MDKLKSNNFILPIEFLPYKQKIFKNLYTDLELIDTQTKVASGSINTSKLKTGPRGWNELGLMIDGTYAEVYFNRELLVTLSLEEVKPDVSYFNSWIYNFYKDDLDADTYIRKPDIACPL